jgi:sarcosine oxidase subunit beta
MGGSPDVIIAGGGIVGCACAYFLTEAGARVLVLERGPLGAGASKAGMSHVITWEEPAMHLALARASQRLYAALAETLPGDIEYRQTGSMAVAEQEDGLAPLQAMLNRLRQAGVEGAFVDGRGLRAIEPRLAPDLAGGAYFPGDSMVNPLAATRALAEGARQFGAEIRTLQGVDGIERGSNGRITGVIAGGTSIPTGCLVIAAGAWSAEVGRMAGVDLPIRPRKGVLAVTAPAPEAFLTVKAILSAGYIDSIHGGDGAGGAAIAANIQQVRNGNLILGTTRAFSGFDVQVESRVARQMLARCARLLPDLRRLQVMRMWAGLRPWSPDLLPLVGPVTAAPGLFVAAGHEGIGITEAPITGLLIRQMIFEQDTELPVGALSPDRFQHSTPSGGEYDQEVQGRVRRQRDTV